jgi:hypothetical protein
MLTKDAATRTVAIYLDGVYTGGGTYTAGQEATGGTSGAFDLASSRITISQGADGLYEMAAVYTTALTEARVQAHARALGFLQ